MPKNPEEVNASAESAAIEANPARGKEEIQQSLDEKKAQMAAVSIQAEELTKSVAATEAMVKDIPHLAAALEIIKAQAAAKQEELNQTRAELAAVQAEFEVLPEMEEAVPVAEAVTEQKAVAVSEPAPMVEASPTVVAEAIVAPKIEESVTEAPIEKPTEARNKFQREAIAKRAAVAHRFQSNIDSLRIPEEWKARVNETMTKEILGDERGGGNIKEYTMEPVQNVNDLTHAPELMKAIDPEIDKQSTELEQLLRDIRDLGQVHDAKGVHYFRNKSGVGIQYENLPKDLGKKLSDEYDAFNKKDKKGLSTYEENQQYSALHAKQIQTIERAFSEMRSIKLPKIRRELKEKIDALESNPKFHGAAMEITGAHRAALKEL